MPTPHPGYNERAWAIDVILEINNYCSARARAIVRAGGEYTVPGQSGCLFPDVLLFGDSSGSMVQQGWELKMPDTAINDLVFVKNAEQKARRLGLNSFVVWNANEAVLYLRNAEDAFTHSKAWPATNIRRRADVVTNRTAWVALLHNIIDDLNELLDRGSISGARPEIAINDALFLDYLDRFIPTLSRTVQRACLTNSRFAAELNIWWAANQLEHPECTQFQGIARVNLINWINRILFAHYLKHFNTAAGAVESILVGTSVQAAIDIFAHISASCDFLNVFKPALGQEHIDPATWNGLIELNYFLKDFRLGSVSQESFHKVIDTALAYSRKKLAGQFSTPRPLADLLVRLTVKDYTKPVIDPCCGTGTIARAVYDIKRAGGVEINDALSSTWASDKFAFPLQLCSIALSDPLGMGEVVQVFCHDAFELTTGESVNFTNPNTGSEIIRSLPAMHAVVSNLPFVRFEDNEKLNPSLSIVRDTLAQNCSGGVPLAGRADLYAYLVLKLRDLVEAHGRIGVISSNSWLAVEWGQQFKEVLMNCFKIRQVVISSEGRWFSTADVVTTILVLEKRESPIDDSERIEFLTTTTRIETWETQPGGVNQMATHMLVDSVPPMGFTRQQYSHSQIESLVSVGIGWNALFGDLSWLNSVSPNLIPVNGLFDIRRGKRQGQDKMFFPASGHGIESQYIRPVLKSARNINGLLATASDDAFCCSDSITTLTANGMTGTLAYISRFRTALNGTNKPLPQVLARAGHEWYEMSPDTPADLVVSMNPDQRLCVHRLRQRSFVNQRLIRFTSQPDINVDIDLCHALMNSVVGMFLIEAIGFGRGLGVLDLNAKKMAGHLHMLNPDALSTNHRTQILAAFAPLLRRNVFDLESELQAQDRLAFDGAVLQAFGIAPLQNLIHASLRQLFHIRQTARS